MDPIYLDYVSVILQITGLWISAIQVMNVYRDIPIESIQMNWVGEIKEYKFSKDFLRFTSRMKYIFILGISLASIGAGLPLLKHSKYVISDPTQANETNSQ